MKEETTVGVVIGRFQTPELHAGHRFLIEHALSGHSDVLIILGSAHILLESYNPLDYETRKAMILKAYPKVHVAEQKDCRHDDVWSKKLDELIAREFPRRRAVFYGSRKSFIPHYSGTYPCVILKAKTKISATNVRSRIAKTPLATKQFRSGMIYAAANRRPLSYQTVDIAVIDYEKRLVLLGRRDEEHGAFRFIGGFVDKKDASLEAAAKRETYEETSGIEIDELKYLGSFRIDDWRYRKSDDGILTAFFIARYIFGAPKATDDLHGLEWVPLESFLERLVDEHRPLGVQLTSHLVSQGLANRS